jgi:flagellar hook-length control protein FliK
MSSIPLSFSALAGLLSIGAPKASDGTAAAAGVSDSFSQLLSIGAAQPDESTAPQSQASVPATPASIAKTSTPAVKTSPAAPLNKQANIPVPVAKNARDTQGHATNQVDKPSRKIAALTDTSDRNNDAKAAPPASTDQSTPVAAVAHANDVASDETDTRPSVKAALTDIGQLLQGIAQILSYAAPVVTTASPVATPAVASGNAPVLPALPAIPAAPVISDASATPDAAPAANTDGIVLTGLDTTPTPLTPEETAMLKNIQAVLQQMQDTLQVADSPAPVDAAPVADNAQSTPLTPDATRNLLSLAATLKQDVTALAQAVAPASVTPPDNAVSQTDLLNVTDASTKLPLPAQTAPAPVIAAAATPVIAQADPFAVKATTKDTTPAKAPAQDNATVSMAAAVSQPVAPLPLATAAPVVAFNAQAATTMYMSQGGADTSGGDGGNQGQGMPQPVVAPGAAGPAQSNNATANTSFAKTLAQSSPTLLDQVSVQVKTAVADGSSKIHIRLDPGDLGKLDIKLTVGADGKTSVAIIADNKNTLDLLQRDTQGLTRALSDAGLSTDSNNLNFSLGGGQQGQGQGQSNPQASVRYQKAQSVEEEALAINTVTRHYTVTMADNGLDIKI